MLIIGRKNPSFLPGEIMSQKRLKINQKGRF